MKQILTTLLLLCSLAVSAQDVKVTGPKRQQTTATKQQSTNNSKKTNTDSTKNLLLSGNIAGHDYVDLGLPSRTLWATCNIGANEPQEYGSLFDLPFKSGSLIRTSYDIASNRWGTNWCLPSDEQFKELKAYCSCLWKSYKGISGYTLKGPNGNVLFLPAAGWTVKDEPIKQRGEYGAYWAGNMPSEATPEYRYLLSFDSKGINVSYFEVFGKQSIRPVVSNH